MVKPSAARYDVSRSLTIPVYWVKKCCENALKTTTATFNLQCFVKRKKASDLMGSKNLPRCTKAHWTQQKRLPAPSGASPACFGACSCVISRSHGSLIRSRKILWELWFCSERLKQLCLLWSAVIFPFFKTTALSACNISKKKKKNGVFLPQSDAATLWARAIYQWPGRAVAAIMVSDGGALILPILERQSAPSRALAPSCGIHFCFGFFLPQYALTACLAQGPAPCLKTYLSERGKEWWHIGVYSEIWQGRCLNSWPLPRHSARLTMPDAVWVKAQQRGTRRVDVLL